MEIPPEYWGRPSEPEPIDEAPPVTYNNTVYEVTEKRVPLRRELRWEFNLFGRTIRLTIGRWTWPRLWVSRESQVARIGYWQIEWWRGSDDGAA